MESRFHDELFEQLEQLDEMLEPQRPPHIREILLLIKEALDVLRDRTNYLIRLDDRG